MNPHPKTAELCDFQPAGVLQIDKLDGGNGQHLVPIMSAPVSPMNISDGSQLKKEMQITATNIAKDNTGEYGIAREIERYSKKECNAGDGSGQTIKSVNGIKEFTTTMIVNNVIM